MATPPCPVCGSAATLEFVELPPVPVFCNSLWATRDEAVASPRGEVTLTHCESCNHVYNAVFDASAMSYGSHYENSLHYSSRFQDYARSLAERLVAAHDLRGRPVVELGCGQGDFLELLCEAGASHGYGFDPGYTPGRSTTPKPDVTIHAAHYEPGKLPEPPACVACRHVLEHIEDPATFLANVRADIGDSGAVFYLEVPDFAYTLDDLGIWDIIYEHCSYFTADSLRHALEASGFEALSIERTFGGQFLGADALTRDVEVSPPAASGMRATARVFGEAFDRTVAEWRDRLGEIERRGAKAAIWGAGSKGVTFLNIVGAGDAIAGAVDLNPHKQGLYIPGTGHRVVAPSDLESNEPDTVIVMNPNYVDEIRADLEARGLKPDVTCV